MKKSSKILIIICLTMIVAGIVLLAVGMLIGSGEDLNFENGVSIGIFKSDAKKMQEAVLPTDIKNINIQHEYSYFFDGDSDIMTDVEITSGSVYSISYFGDERINDFSYTIEGDTIYIYIEDDIEYFKVFGSDSKLLITVPTSQSLGEITINSTVEDLEINNITAETLNVKSDVGNIEIDNSTFFVTNITADVGNLEIENSTLGTGKIKVDVGNVDIEDCSVESLECSVNIGDVDIVLQGYSGEYSAYASAEIGSVNISSGISNGLILGTKQISVSADIGSIDISLS